MVLTHDGYSTYPGVLQSFGGGSCVCNMHFKPMNSGGNILAFEVSSATISGQLITTMVENFEILILLGNTNWKELGNDGLQKIKLCQYSSIGKDDSAVICHLVDTFYSSMQTQNTQASM